MRYGLWDGKKIIGYYTASERLMGTSVVFPVYNGKDIVVPIHYLAEISNLAPITTITYVLDIRKKSKRQISIILNRY